MSSVYWAQEITILLHLVLLVAMIGSLNIQLFKDHKVHYSYKIATSTFNSFSNVNISYIAFLFKFAMEKQSKVSIMVPSYMSLLDKTKVYAEINAAKIQNVIFGSGGQEIKCAILRRTTAGFLFQMQLIGQQRKVSIIVTMISHKNKL